MTDHIELNPEEAIRLIEALESNLLAEAERDYDDQVMTGRITFKSAGAKRNK